MARFTDRVALVTGAASGIGRATVHRLAAEGARVVAVDLAEDGLAETLSALPGKARSTAHPFALDVSDEAAVAACVSAVQTAFDRIDVLCNNAGIASGSMARVPDQDMAVWQRILAVNLLGTVHFTKHVARVMQAQAEEDRTAGAIVNTASVAGIRSGAGGNAYSASKAGVISFTQTAACDLGPWGIRVNAVCPGLVETAMTRPVFDRAREAGKEDRLGARCELRRYGRPEEIAAVIAFLASDDASFVTGQALPVDGGNTASLNMPGMKV